MKTLEQLLYEMADAGRPIEELLAVVASISERNKKGHSADSKYLLYAFASLLPWANYERIERYVVDYWLNHCRNRALLAFAKVGRSLETSHLVRTHGQSQLMALIDKKVPIVLMFVHYGPQRGVLQSVSDLGLSVTGIMQAWGARSNYPGVDFWTMRAGDDAAKYFPMHAVSVLRDNGIVLLALDGDLGETAVSAPCLKRMMSFRQGIFSIQRIARATVIPVYSRWSEDGFIETYFEEPLVEGSVLTAEIAAAWLQKLIIDVPSDIRWPMLEKLIRAPYIG